MIDTTHNLNEFEINQSSRMALKHITSAKIKSTLILSLHPNKYSYLPVCLYI